MSEETAELLAGATSAFADAVHDLVGRRPDTIARDDGSHETIIRAGLYLELQEAKHGEQVGQGSRRPAPGSRPPGWTDALSLVVRIDQRVATWWTGTPDDDGLPVTVRRLYALVDHNWRPQDIAGIRQMTREVTAWVERAKVLLPTEEVHTYELRAPCPACGETVMYADDGSGEQVRRYVLQTTIQSARCLACETRWDAEHFVALARQLGGLPSGVLE